MSTFYATIGDANKLISTILSDENGVKDVTGATIVFHARSQSNPTITISGSGAIVTAAAGLISYTLTAANLTTPTIADSYDVEWQVTIGSVVTTWPTPGYDLLIIQGQLA